MGALWLLALLSVMASSTTRTSRSDLLLLNGQQQTKQQYLLAEAGIQVSLLNLLASSSGDRWLGDGDDYRLLLHEGQVDIRVSDEAGKINVNLAAAELLRKLLQAVDMDEREKDSLVDAILDWRDRDSLKRLYGAEKDDYAAAGLPEIGNRHFKSLEEILLVMGMNKEIFRQLRPLITVDSNQRGVNPLVASKAVLSVISDNSEADIEDYISLRRRSHRDKVPQVFPLIIPRSFLSRSLGVSYTIETTASIFSKSTSSLQAKVTLRRGSLSRPIEFKSWRLVGGDG